MWIEISGNGIRGPHFVLVPRDFTRRVSDFRNMEDFLHALRTHYATRKKCV